MSERLSELLRQRALLQQHLAWLDREIASATTPTTAPVPSMVSLPAPVALPTLPAVAGATPPVATIVGTPTLASNPATGPASPPAVTPNPDAILDKYRTEPRSLQQDVRKGCFLYFAAALLILALGVLGLYFALRSR